MRALHGRLHRVTARLRRCSSLQARACCLVVPCQRAASRRTRPRPTAVCRLILYRVMRQRLKLAGSELSPEAALAELRRIQHHTVSIDSAVPIHGMSTVQPRQIQALAALRIKNLRSTPSYRCCSGNSAGLTYADQSLAAVGVELGGPPPSGSCPTPGPRHRQKSR